MQWWWWWCAGTWCVGYKFVSVICGSQVDRGVSTTVRPPPCQRHQPPPGAGQEQQILRRGRTMALPDNSSPALSEEISTSHLTGRGLAGARGSHQHINTSTHQHTPSHIIIQTCSRPSGVNNLLIQSHILVKVKVSRREGECARPLA